MGNGGGIVEGTNPLEKKGEREKNEGKRGRGEMREGEERSDGETVKKVKKGTGTTGGEEGSG